MLKLGIFCIALLIVMHKEAYLLSNSFRDDTFQPTPPGPTELRVRAYVLRVVRIIVGAHRRRRSGKLFIKIQHPPHHLSFHSKV